MDEEVLTEEQQQAKYLLLEALQKFKELCDMKYQPILTDLNGIRIGAKKGERAYQRCSALVPATSQEIAQIWE